MGLSFSGVWCLSRDRSQRTDFADLISPAGGLEISDVAQRGMSLPQLLKIVAFMRQRCNDEGVIRGWTDMNPLSPSQGEILRVNMVNLYHLNEQVILPATQARSCSFVEVIAVKADEQCPEWFISHWWGEPVVHFVACVQSFAQKRAGRAVFWICAYANNQHALAGDVSPVPEQSSFRRAMQTTQGTLMVLDKMATPFNRVWCVYEAAVTLTKSNKSLELITFVDGSSNTAALPEVTEEGGQMRLQINGSVEMITEGYLSEDERKDVIIQVKGSHRRATKVELKAMRERSFPLDVSARGLGVTVQDAESSVPADKDRILNEITGMHNLDVPPPVHDETYDTINGLLRARFGITVLHRVVRQGPIDMVGKALAAISSDKTSATLNLDFNNCSLLTDDMVRRIPLSIPQQTLHLNVNLAETEVGDVGAVSFSTGLMKFQNLLHLTLSFRKTNVGNKGVAALGGALAKLTKLERLELLLSPLKGLGDDGVLNIAGGLAHMQNLAELTMNIGGTGMGDHGAQALGASLAQLRNLERLEFHLFTVTVGDAGIRALMEGLAGLQSLKTLALYFHRNKIGDDGANAVGTSVHYLQKLTSLTIDLARTKVGNAGIAGLMASFRQGVGERESPIDATLTITMRSKSIMGFVHLQSLKSLTLFLGESKVGDNGAVAIGNGLEHVRNLTDFVCSLSRTSVGDVGAEAIAAGIAHLKNLEGIELSFSRTRVGDAGFAKIALSLALLPSLRRLDLRCSETAVRPECQNVLSLDALRQLTLG